MRDAAPSVIGSSRFLSWPIIDLSHSQTIPKSIPQNAFWRSHLSDVGYRSSILMDPHRNNWDGTSQRPLAWSAWYPTSSPVSTTRPAKTQLFDLGQIVVDGELAGGHAVPVVLLSHGTGGSPESMGWLAHRLAQEGRIVIGAHHHGNTGREAYRAEGFLCGWERALDLSTLLSMLSDEGPFAGRLDLSRVDAVGFSIGGYTVLALAGALTSMERYFQWAQEAGGQARGPREFPGVVTQLPDLLEISEPFRRSWARQGDNFHDTRVRTVTAIAPPPPVRAFDERSLAAISIPVTLITGEADQEAPSHVCANWLEATNPAFHRISVGEDVGHYTFLGRPARDVPEDLKFIFADNPGVDRETIHETTAQAVLAGLGRTHSANTAQ